MMKPAAKSQMKEDRESFRATSKKFNMSDKSTFSPFPWIRGIYRYKMNQV